MIKEARYEIRSGKFGQYFYDAAEERDLALADVLLLLNRYDEHDSPTGLVHRAAFEEMQERARCAESCYQELDKERYLTEASLLRQLEQTTAERDALADNLAAEQRGSLALRKEFGAKDNETMWGFISRLASESLKKTCVPCNFIGKPPYCSRCGKPDRRAEIDAEMRHIRSLLDHACELIDRACESANEP